MTMARLLDGKALAKMVRRAIAQEVQALAEQYGRTPALGLLMVGNRPDSALYVKNKRKACAAVGIHSEDVFLDVQVTQQELLEHIQRLNADQRIDGILVQLPLPPALDAHALIDAIDPSKDVDGLHPFNVGELAMKHRLPFLVPCTANGIIAMLDAADVDIQGKTAVVLGRSDLVGNPIALMLQKRNATVIQCHSLSRDLPQYVQQADIVVAACGQPYLVRGSWLKPGAAVIDVGINFVQDTPEQQYHGNVNKAGFKIVGDVSFLEAQQTASVLSPVPGGVGPMTVAMLLQNVVTAYKRHVGYESDVPLMAHFDQQML